MYKIRKTNKHKVAERLNREIFSSEEAIDLSDSECWLVFEGAEPVGFASYKKIEDMAYLNRAGIVEGARGCGLHKRMIGVRLRHAKKAGLETAITYTVMDNPESFSNLQKCGFKLYIPDYKWIDDSVLYWSKTLKNT